MTKEEITDNTLKTIVNSINESTIIIATDGKILFANKAFAEGVGKDPKEIIGKSIFELFHPDVAERRRSHVEQVIKTKETSSFEDERAGRHYIAYMTPILDPSGNIDRLLIIAYDITEKKKLENELINTKEQLTSILNSIDEKIYIADLNTYEILFTNSYTKEIFGDDIDGKLCYEVLHKFDKPCESCPNEIIQKLKGRPYKAEKYNPLTNRYYAMTNKIIKWPDGRDVKFCIGTDITDKKNAELALEEKEKTYRTILENLQIGFFRSTPDGAYIMANKALAELYGYSSPEELMNKVKDIGNQIFVNREDRINFVNILEKYDYVENFETKQYKIDGSVIWTLISARRVKDDYGKTIYYEGTTIDITQRRQLEDELLSEKEKFTILVENAPVAMALIDKNGTYFYVNKKFNEIFGYDLIDIPDGRTWFKKAFPDLKYRQEAISCWRDWVEPLRVGESIPRVFTVVCKDGSKKRININCVILAQGLYIVTYEDITEKERIEARYRSIFENATAGIYQTTKEGKFIIANPAFVRMLGYNSFEELTDSITDITTQLYVDPEDRKKIMDMLDSGLEVKDYETQFYKKDGSKIWVSINMHPVYDEEGNLLYYQGIDEDITERKNAQMMLKEEKEKFSILTENAPFGMALIDANETYLYINPKFKEMFGYDLADIPDRDTWFKKAYPDEDYRNKAISFWKEEIETFKVGESTSKRFIITCKDGSKKIVDIIPVILASGLFLMAFVDITEKEKMEVNYRSIFENASEGIAQTTLDGKFIVANPALLKLLGYDSFEDLTSSIKDITSQLYVNPQDRERMLQIIKNGKDVKGYEAQLYRKDGKKVWVSESMSAVYDEKGKIMYLQAIVEDITDKKKKEEELARLRQQYTHAQKMEAIGTLTGGIAHDFNNFLTAIMGYATLSEMKINKDFHIKTYIDQIQKVAKNMADLVKNLLAFSRKQPINLMPLDINTEIKETRKLLKRLLTENIDLTILTSDKNPIVMADKTQLSQILFNMATNARDAMPDGGRFTIKIDTTTIDEDFIKIQGFGKKGNYAHISISDTGIGMDRDILDKIFDPFFTTKEPGKGTGLGLASVYGIVKQHKGYITVESSPGSGTTFNIYLPLVDIAPKEDTKQKVVFHRGTGTILIGEDDENVRVFLKDILEHHGYRTIIAKDGEELIDKFKNNKDMDMVITDFIMPKKSGAHAYKEIRAINDNIRFIFISGYDRDMLSKIPSDDKKVRFISKPVSAEILIQTVEELITNK